MALLLKYLQKSPLYYDENLLISCLLISMSKMSLQSALKMIFKDNCFDWISTTSNENIRPCSKSSSCTFVLQAHALLLFWFERFDRLKTYKQINHQKSQKMINENKNKKWCNSSLLETRFTTQRKELRVKFTQKCTTAINNRQNFRQIGYKEPDFTDQSRLLFYYKEFLVPKAQNQK